MKSMRSLSALIGLCLLAGCGSGLEKFPLTMVTGTVTCEGQAVPDAIVFFEPVRSSEKDSPQIGKQGFALTDAQGKFTVSTYGQNDGAVVATHIVRVGKSEKSPPCPCALNSSVELQRVEVVKGPPMNFDLVLPKKAAGVKDEVLEEDD